jgi:hypothetical protein
MNVNFSFQFSGGAGHAEVKVMSHGENVTQLIFDSTGTQSRDLPPGLYLISVKGNSPSHGTVFTISHPTTEPTPDNYPEGVIIKGYVLRIP